MFRTESIGIYIDGGWGVDALVGFESRAHNDIDIFIEMQNKERAIKQLKDNGYSETMMEYTTPNHTVWQDDNARIIDLHIFTCNDKDDLVFEDETFPKEVFSGKGRIGGLEVDCITPQWQVIFHSGYQLDEDDIKDVLLLCNKFNIAVPNEIARNFSIDTDRLTLRQWREGDAETLYKYASDGRVSEMALWPRHTSVDMSREVIRNFFQPNPYTFAMVLKETDEPIGCMGLVPIGEEHFPLVTNEREVGYWIGHPYWGKGLTTEALSALIDFCRDTLRLDSLLITTDANNTASQRVAEKCGFNFIENCDYNGIYSRAYELTLMNNSSNHKEKTTGGECIRLVLPQESLIAVDMRIDDKPYVGVFNKGLAEFIHKEVFGWYLSLIIDYNRTVGEGMPDEDDTRKMLDFSDILTERLSGSSVHPNALFLGRVTGDGYTQIMWYVNNPDVVDKLLKELINSKAFSLEFEYEMTYDPDWQEAAYWRV